jgi:signal transduction histidine kinase
MRERAQALGGRFALEAVAPTGVRLRVSLPLTGKQAHE